MSTPIEPLPTRDVVTNALAAEDLRFRTLFGPQDTWSEAVLREYFVDQRIARQLATNWGEAA